MKIIDFEVIPFRIAFHDSYQISGGIETGIDHVLLKLETDQGMAGWGEAAPTPQWAGESQEDVVATLEGRLAPRLLGREPFDIEAITLDLNRALPDHHFAKCAIDMALYDLQGKALGQPLYRLLGGDSRKRVALVASIGIGSPDTARQLAQSYLGQGFSLFKLKIGQDPDGDLDRVAAVREVIGSWGKIRVDANQGYSFDVALRTLKKMEQYDLELIEQPLPRWDLEGMAALASALDTPIMADEGLFSPAEAIQHVKTRAASIFSIKLAKTAGITQGRKIAAIAEGAGIPLYIGSMHESGVGTFAAAHFARAVPNVEYGCGLVGVYRRKDDIIEERLVVNNRGEIELPHEGVGLGVTVNEEKIQRYRVPINNT